MDRLSSGDRILLYLDELWGLPDLGLLDSDDKNLLKSEVRSSPFVELDTECFAWFFLKPGLCWSELNRMIRESAIFEEVSDGFWLE